MRAPPPPRTESREESGKPAFPRKPISETLTPPKPEGAAPSASRGPATPREGCGPPALCTALASTLHFPPRAPARGRPRASDVITLRRRLRLLPLRRRSCWRELIPIPGNGFPSPPACAPALYPWAAMVSPRGRRNGSGAWEEFAGWVCTGHSRDGGVGDGGAWLQREQGTDCALAQTFPSTVCSSSRPQPARRAFGAARQFDTFPLRGEGRREERFEGDLGAGGSGKVVYLFSIAPNLNLPPTWSLWVPLKL